jgi:hypothetical protein
MLQSKYLLRLIGTTAFQTCHQDDAWLHCVQPYWDRIILQKAAAACCSTQEYGMVPYNSSSSSSGMRVLTSILSSDAPLRLSGKPLAAFWIAWLQNAAKVCGWRLCCLVAARAEAANWAGCAGPCVACYCLKRARRTNCNSNSRAAVMQWISASR